MPEISFTIDELARTAGTTTRTIRFYAQEKLLPGPSGYRGRTALYGPEHLEKLELIRVLKDKYLPLDTIKKVVANPEKIAFLQEKLKINGAIFELLGYKPATFTQKQAARKNRMSDKEIARLIELGFLFPSSTETGPRYTADDLEIINSLKQLGKLGFTPEELTLVPAALEKLADAFFEIGHEKLHATDAARKSKETIRMMETVVTANKQLIGLIYQQALRRAIDRHRHKKEG